MASVQSKKRVNGITYYAVYGYETGKIDKNGNKVIKQKWESCESEEAAEIRVAEIELAQKKNKFISPSRYGFYVLQASR